MLGQGSLYGGWSVVVQGVVPKVVRDMAEIRYVVGFRTNLQLVVLKILSVVSCEEGCFCSVCEMFFSLFLMVSETQITLLLALS